MVISNVHTPSRSCVPTRSHDISLEASANRVRLVTGAPSAWAMRASRSVIHSAGWPSGSKNSTLTSCQGSRPRRVKNISRPAKGASGFTSRVMLPITGDTVEPAIWEPKPKSTEGMTMQQRNGR